MADKMTPEQRHRCMSRIRSRNTKPEVLVRRWLWHYGYRYRLNVKTLAGRPDIVLRRYRTVVFVNGCFWHGHDCAGFRLPQSNADFWRAKIERNRSRDNRNLAELRGQGWHVIVLWECQLKKATFFQTMQALDLALSQNLLSLHARPAATIVPLQPDAASTEPSMAAEPRAPYAPAPPGEGEN